MEDKQNEQKNLEEAYAEFQMLEQQIKQLQTQIQTLDTQILEIKDIDQGLNDIKKVKVGKEVLFPVTSGMFLKGKLTENNKILVNVGAGVVVDKTFAEAKNLLAEQVNEISNLRDQFIMQFQSLAVKIEESEKKLAKLVPK